MFDKYNYWIVRNLKYYRNTTIPSILIDTFGTRKVENELCRILNRKIKVFYKKRLYKGKNGKPFEVKEYEAMEERL